jgi:hypothetical protein
VRFLEVLLVEIVYVLDLGRVELEAFAVYGLGNGWSSGLV